ncbi:type II toxin-antitoxin system prevent-host-death family antitoxin [Georgenia sp. MJ173]|uniref:type II toxin-antitoxin system Phd/YefM family antitoxin n=1 Tax=Georgenia sunbinii TaxID=3117728 RepID=UPI002F26C4C8
MPVVNVGQAKNELSKLLAMAEAGEEVVVARDGVPIVRLVPVRQERPGARFLAGKGILAGQVRIGADFELTDSEIDEMLSP